MKITEVCFSDDEKKYLKDGIVANALGEERCLRKKGFEFEFDKANFPFLLELLFFCKVELYNDMLRKEPPDHPELISRTVIELKYWLIGVDGQEISSNLDYDFEQSIINELTI